jgi:hypothetical protein
MLAGKLLFEVLRHAAPKGFRQRRPLLGGTASQTLSMPMILARSAFSSAYRPSAMAAGSLIRVEGEDEKPMKRVFVTIQED